MVPLTEILTTGQPREDCPICSGREVAWLSETAAETYRFARCRDCRFVFLNPMPDRDDLAQLYESNTYGIRQNYYPKSASRLRRSIGRSLKLLPFVFRKTVLDVGCGGGFMVEAMRLYGAKAHGIDVNPVSVAYAKKRFRNNSFYCENFDVFSEKNLIYDFVYCSDLLEHIGDLDYMMSFFRKVVKPGGRIYVNTPDYDHPKVPRNLKDWDVYDPPYHVQFFNFHNASILFGRYGFQMVKRISHRKPGLHFIAAAVDELLNQAA